MNEAKPKTYKFNAIFVIFFIALLIRLPVFFIYKNIPLADDTINEYIPIAHNLLSKQGYSIEGVSVAARMPLYPIFLAISKILFKNSFIPLTQIILVILECFICVFIYHIAKLLINKQAGVVAGIFSALYILPTYLSLKLTTETIFSFFIVIASKPKAKRGNLIKN